MKSFSISTTTKDPINRISFTSSPQGRCRSLQGLNQGVNGLPLKGWPLTGIDQLRPNMGAQVQKPFLQNPSQFQLLSPQQQQQYLAQAQAQGNLGNSPNYADMDPRRFKVLPRGNLNSKDGQPTGNDGSIGSPMQSSSPKVRGPSQDQAEYIMKERTLIQEQVVLREQCAHQLQQSIEQRETVPSSESSDNCGLELDLDLFIGRPERRSNTNACLLQTR